PDRRPERGREYPRIRRGRPGGGRPGARVARRPGPRRRAARARGRLQRLACPGRVLGSARRHRRRLRARGRSDAAPGVARGAAESEWRRALRPRARRADRPVTFEEARAAFPVLERLAYLNAGTNGPLARATAEAM